MKDCLETGGGSIVQGGRYLVFKLPPGPLGELFARLRSLKARANLVPPHAVSEECRICFEEFVVNDKLARLPCLCYFHQVRLASRSRLPLSLTLLSSTGLHQILARPRQKLPLPR